MIRIIVFVLAISLETIIVTVPEAASAEPLRVGVISSLSAKDTYGYYLPIMKYIEHGISQPVEIAVRDRHWEFDSLMLRKDVRAGFVSPLCYIEKHAKSEIELLVVPQINGNPYYDTYMVVHKTNEVSNLAELRGKRVASAPGDFAPPRFKSDEIKATPEKFFSSIQFVHNLTEALFYISRKEVEDAIVDSIFYGYSTKRKNNYASETRLLQKLIRISVPPFVVKKDMPPAMKAKLREILLSMHTNPEGIAILKDMGFDKFIVFANGIYRTTN